MTDEPMVFAVTRNYDYEGFSILGIFDTPDKARAFADRQKWRADGIEVLDYVVNAPADGYKVTP